MLKNYFTEENGGFNMKLSIDRKNILTALLAFFMIGVLFWDDFEKREEKPEAVKGVMDISGWNLEKDGPLKLEGEWEFYWNELLDHDDFQSDGHLMDPDGYFNVPSVWNNYEIDGEKLPGHGYATYRLHVKGAEIDELKAFKILTESTSYRVAVNGKAVAKSGVISTSKSDFKPEYDPKVAYFENESEEFEVIVQISNFTYARGGFWHEFEFGTADQMTSMKVSSAKRGMLFFGAVFGMILYHLTIYWLQRKSKSILYFILAMAVMSLRIFFTGEYFILSIIPGIDFDTMIRIEYITIYLGAVMWFGFINEVYRDEKFKSIVRRVFWYAFAITVFILLLPVNIFTGYIVVVEIFVVLLALLAFWMVSKAALKKSQGAKLLLWGVALFCLAYIHDCLYYLNVIKSHPGGWLAATTFMMIFIQSYILAARYSRSFDEIEELSSRMISLDRLKDEFLANTSHEIRTPLHGMISITESVLESGKEHMDPTQRENLSIVAASGKRLANLVNDILDYSRLKYGDIKMVRNSVDMEKIIDKVFAVQNHLKGNKRVVLVKEMPMEACIAYADADRITQVLYNLVGNAVKFTQEGDVRVSVKKRNYMLEVSVRDSGIGISEEKLERIFKSSDPGNISLGFGEGSGMGLSITKKLVEIQGGRIWAYSRLLEGSEFVFTVPVDFNSKDQTNIEAQQDMAGEAIGGSEVLGVEYSKKNLNGFTVLAVDDDYVNLHSLYNILSVDGYQVISADNGRRALEILTENRDIDLVILDIMMPGISGYETCRRIRENYSMHDLPVIMLTAQNNSESILTGFKSGANDFLPKPFETSELKARVKTLIELKKSVHHAINAEMAFLQAQIKPHFLYNALNTIVSFCWSDPEKAAELILELSNYLRNSFDFSNMDRFVSIDREMDFVQSYIAIEKARFEDRINIHYDVDPVDFMIPTLLLQPVVENAIKHGILENRESGNVVISIKRKSGFILIEVEDDGKGMDKTKIEEIFDDKASGRGVGLRNIDKRLKRIYGYGIEIESGVEKGTTVSIRIPNKRGDEFDQDNIGG